MEFTEITVGFLSFCMWMLCIFLQYVLYDFVCLSVSVKSITAKYSRFCIVSFFVDSMFHVSSAG